MVNIVFPVLSYLNALSVKLKIITDSLLFVQNIIKSLWLVTVFYKMLQVSYMTSMLLFIVYKISIA